MAARVLSSSFTPVYPTNPTTGNMLVEVTNSGDTLGVQRVPNINIVTGPFTIIANSKSVSIANSGSVNGMLLGKPIRAGMVISFEAPTGDTLASITGDATGTEFTIVELR